LNRNLGREPMPLRKSPQSVLTLSTISQKKKEAKKKNHYYDDVLTINSDLNLKAPAVE